MIMGPEATPYEGGFFRCSMVFPREYPLQPPKMKFLSEIWHPNVFPNGDVCISILHPPGEDKYGYEDASERWLPVHTVETIGMSLPLIHISKGLSINLDIPVLSVISMLSSPNDESPANIEAAVRSVRVEKRDLPIDNSANRKSFEKAQLRSRRNAAL